MEEIDQEIKLHPQIEKIMKRWNNTKLEHIVTPVLNFIQHYPIASLFALVMVGLIALPLVCFFIFVLSTLMFTFCGALIVVGTFSSVALGIISIIIFFSVIASTMITASIVLIYGTAVELQKSWQIVKNTCKKCI